MEGGLNPKTVPLATAFLWRLLLIYYLGMSMEFNKIVLNIYPSSDQALFQAPKLYGNIQPWKRAKLASRKSILYTFVLMCIKSIHSRSGIGQPPQAWRKHFFKLSIICVIRFTVLFCPYTDSCDEAAGDIRAWLQFKINPYLNLLFHRRRRDRSTRNTRPRSSTPRWRPE